MKAKHLLLSLMQMQIDTTSYAMNPRSDREMSYQGKESNRQKNLNRPPFQRNFLK